jgi:thiol-disulfide isomerase/thioredoxin
MLALIPATALAKVCLAHVFGAHAVVGAGDGAQDVWPSSHAIPGNIDGALNLVYNGPVTDIACPINKGRLCLDWREKMSEQINPDRGRFWGPAIMGIAAAEQVVLGAAGAQSSRINPADEGVLASLGRATEWLNSPPLTAAGLRGKVVLIDFWTYTCINWLRSLPYVRAWAEKYKDQGLVVIGVHAPEFPFEKNVDNVRRAAKDMRIDYPIAIDNDYAIWRAFENEYWPALYFIDAQGHVRHHQFGEGEYEESEMIIQRLLAEAGIGGLSDELVSVDARGAEVAADWGSLKSPENYVGYERTENFASPGGAVLDKRHVYTAPAQLRLNQWSLSGDWTVEKQATVLNRANGRIADRFHARDLHLVMGPAARGTFVRFRVLVDGHPPGAAHGTDADDQGNGTVTEQRLYQLIRQTKPIADRQFEIELLDSGVEAFAFTFG